MPLALLMINGNNMHQQMPSPRAVVNTDVQARLPYEGLSRDLRKRQPCSIWLKFSS